LPSLVAAADEVVDVKGEEAQRWLASKLAAERENGPAAQLPREVPATSGAPECSSCGKASGALKRCSRCKSAAYCSVECQKRAWRQHKLVCAAAGSS